MGVGEFTVTPSDMDELEKRVMKAIQNEHLVDPKKHWSHHAWIDAEMEQKRITSARNEEIRRHVQKWGIIGVISFVAGAVWHYVTKGNHGA